MYCRNCGNQLNGNEEFCSECGNKIKQKSKKKNKKILLWFFISILLISIVVVGIFLLKGNKNGNKNYGSTSSAESIIYSYSDGNVPKFIDGKFSDALVRSSNDVLTALESIKEQIGFKDISKELVLESEEKSQDITYYKFNQVYNGIPVLYQNIVVDVDKNNNILGYSGYYIPNIDLTTVPKKDSKAIEEIIKNNLGTNPNIISNELSIIADYNNQQLVYHAVGYSDSKAVELIVDANSGEIISEIDIFDYSTYSYTGTGMNNKTHTINLEEYFDLLGGAKNRYRFYDSVRNIAIADYRNTGQYVALLASLVPGVTPISVSIIDNKIDMTYQNEEFIQSAITTMAHYEKIYDYYKNVLGRNSFDNKGSKIIVNLGITAKTFSNQDFNNAFWCSLSDQMYIGNYKGKSFSASLDVLAHEFTHGVISKTAKFAGAAKKEDSNKAFESGALNEAYADILGALIEGENWTMAENNGTLRSMENPNQYENPSEKGGKYYYPDGFLSDDRTLEQFLKDNNLNSVIDYDKGGVHTNSNVVSHAAYLMYEAGAFKDREEMAKVWYNSLFLLSSYSNFEDCALAVIKTAKKFGLSDSSIYKINKVFEDTKILEPKDFTIKGTITSGEETLEDVNIQVYLYNDKSEIANTKSNTNGEYELKLKSGTYKIKFTKEGFETIEEVIVLNGNTNLDVSLASNEMDIDTEENILTSNCKANKCYNLKIYFVDGENTLKENYEVYAVAPSTIIDANIIVNTINKTFGSELLSYKNNTFYISMGEFTIDFAWYYKGTNNKFEWNKPINEDVEIEMKLLNGVIDNDFFIDMNDFINKWDSSEG